MKSSLPSNRIIGADILLSSRVYPPAERSPGTVPQDDHGQVRGRNSNRPRSGTSTPTCTPMTPTRFRWARTSLMVSNSGANGNYGYGVTRLKGTQVVDLDELDYSRLKDGNAFFVEVTTLFVLESDYPGCRPRRPVVVEGDPLRSPGASGEDPRTTRSPPALDRRPWSGREV